MRVRPLREGRLREVLVSQHLDVHEVRNQNHATILHRLDAVKNPLGYLRADDRDNLDIVP